MTNDLNRFTDHFGAGVRDAMNPIRTAEPVPVDPASGYQYVGATPGDPSAIDRIGDIGAGARGALMGYKPAGYSASGYSASAGKVGSDGLVEKRITGLLDSKNPYMQQAETAGKQFAAKRGLLNSTMAGQAMQNSSIQAALPIAQHDASSVNTQSLENQRASNEANRFTAGEANAAGRFNAGEVSAANRFGAEANNNLIMQTVDNQFAENTSQLDHGRQVDTLNVEADINNQLADFDQGRAIEMQDLKYKWEMEIEKTKSGSTAWQQFMDGVKDILTADMSRERRRESLRIIFAQADDRLGFIDGVMTPLPLSGNSEDGQTNERDDLPRPPANQDDESVGWGEDIIAKAWQANRDRDAPIYPG